jgi:DHA2 family methylenomycin A resistance protein-like MFS transporter
VNFAYYGLIFVFSLFFQWRRHFSPQEIGLAFLPMTIVLMIASIAGGRLVARLGARRLMVSGQVLAATGYLLLLAALATGSYAMLAAPMFLAATGIALTVPTMVNLTLSSVDSSRAGIASGVLNTARQVGGMLGVTVCGYLVRNLAEASFMRGVRLSLAIAVVLLLAGALASHLGLQRGD